VHRLHLLTGLLRPLAAAPAASAAPAPALAR
jgi:hypothetical protein